MKLLKKIKSFFSFKKSVFNEEYEEISEFPYVFLLKNKTKNVISDFDLFKAEKLNDSSKIEVTYGFPDLTFEQFCQVLYNSHNSSISILIDRIKFTFESIDDINCAEFSFCSRDLEGSSFKKTYLMDYEPVRLDLSEKSMTFYNINTKLDDLSIFTILKINSNSKFRIAIYQKQNQK